MRTVRQTKTGMLAKKSCEEISASALWLTYGNKKIYEEGEEGPAEEECHHEGEHHQVSEQPGQQQRPLPQHRPQQQQERRHQVGGGGRNNTAQEVGVVAVQPVQTAPHRLGHLDVPVVPHQPGVDPLAQLRPGVLADERVDGGEDDGHAGEEGAAAGDEEAASAFGSTAAAAVARHGDHSSCTVFTLSYKRTVSKDSSCGELLEAY